MQNQLRFLDTLLSLSRLEGITLSSAQILALEHMRTCRTRRNGGRILICPTCKTTMVLYNPCNKRGCPTCYRKNQLRWQQQTIQRLLPTSHYHLTFSLPDQFTAVWLRHKRAVMESLFKAVKSGIDAVGKKHGLLLGSLLVFQSHARGMSYKPHVHCVLSSGGLDDNNRWKELGSIPLRELEAITKNVFEEDICTRLQGQITIPKKGRYRVHVEIHKGTGNHIIAYLAQSRNGVVIDLEQDFQITDDYVEFNEQVHGEVRTVRLTPRTFLERYLNHIPLEGSVTARYYGLYSNRHKDHLVRAFQELGATHITSIEPYYELCPKCKAEMVCGLVFKKNEELSFSIYGYYHDPPDHGDLGSVA